MSKCGKADPSTCRLHGNKANTAVPLTYAEYEAHREVEREADKSRDVFVEEVLKVVKPKKAVTKVETIVEPELTWDDSVAEQVYEELPGIRVTAPSMMTQKLSHLAKQHNFKIDYEKFSSQALASQMGTVLEYVFKAHLDKEFASNPDITYIRGDDLFKKINQVRRSKNKEEVAAYKKRLVEEYYFAPEYAEEVLKHANWLKLQFKPKSIHIPDAIVIDKTGDVPVIRCGEMKASGQNDSSSVPENIDKLVPGTRNSAIEAWAGNPNVKIERAILITAASKTKDGKFGNKSKWENEIAKLRDTGSKENIKVFCNEEAFSWLAKRQISSAEYEKNFITTSAWVELKRIATAQGQPLD